MSARTRIFSKRNLGVALLGAVLAAAFVVQFLAAGVPQEDTSPSAASTKPEGRRALRELLEHFEGGEGRGGVELWNKPPGSLPRRGGILVLPQVPIGFSNLAVREEDEEEGDEETLQPPLQEDLLETAPTFAEHHPRHYARFVHQGGTLVAPASEEMLDWLEESAEIESVAAVRRTVPLFDLAAEESESAEAQSEGEAETVSWGEVSGYGVPGSGHPGIGSPGSEETLEIAWRDRGGLRLDLSELSGLASRTEQPRVLLRLAEDSDREARPEELIEGGDLRGVIVPLGEGRVVLLSDLDVFDNQNLAENDHASLAACLAKLLLVVSSGRHSGGFEGLPPILFDEYSLGGWTPPGTTGLLLGGAVGWITLHLLLLVLLLVWRRSWAGPFPRDPDQIEGLAPLERTRAEGALLLRAKRYDLLAEHLFDGVFHRLERRLLRSTTERPSGESGEAPSQPDLDAWRSGRMNRVRGVLTDWDPDADLPKLPQPQSVQGRQELHRFQESLRQWEHTVQRRLDPQLNSELSVEASRQAEKERASSGALTS